MNGEIKRGRGRPKEEGSFERIFRFCGNDEHIYMRDTLIEELEKGGGDVLREALETLYRFKAIT